MPKTSRHFAEALGELESPDGSGDFKTQMKVFLARHLMFPLRFGERDSRLRQQFIHFFVLKSTVASSCELESDSYFLILRSIASPPTKSKWRSNHRFDPLQEKSDKHNQLNKSL